MGRERIAVVADIHGNLDALNAVIRKIDELKCGEVWNLGDCLSGPLDAAGTAARLMPLAWKTVRGNHDRQLVDRPPDQMGPSDRVAWAQLGSRELEWLRSLPAELGGVGCDQCIRAFHATPSTDLVYLMETVTQHGVMQASCEEVAERLAGVTADIMLTGHSHLPRLMRLPGGPLVVNPGSVGLPAYDDTTPWPHVMETGSPHARFATLELAEGCVSVAFHNVEYATGRAVDLARRNGREDWACALKTGFAIRP